MKNIRQLLLGISQIVLFIIRHLATRIIKNEQPVYDWPVLEANFKAVITSLKNEDETKQVNRQALKAVEKKTQKQFETIIKMNRKILRLIYFKYR